jgi:cell division transport system ATP-binding protein
MIEFLGINKTYANRVKALDGVDIRFNQDEFIVLVGPSGAGKSTLVRLLICEEKPDTGAIMIGGYDVTKLKDWEIPFFRRKIGVVFQDFKLLPNKTVFENVAFALEVAGVTDAEIKRKVPKILQIVGLSTKTKHKPSELSGGERQRVAIARALVHNPKLLIADEPTGNLDPKNAWDIIELLLKINRMGTIVLLTTHNKEIVNRLNKRVVTIKAGKIASDQSKGKYTI